MKQFTGKANLKDKPDVRTVSGTKPWVFGLMLKCSLMMVMIFSAIFLRVYFSDRTAKLERRAEQIRLESHATDLEIQNLIARREKMMSPGYIRGKIAEYKLSLRPTAATQIRYLKTYHVSDSVPDSREYASSQGAPRSGDVFQTADAR